MARRAAIWRQLETVWRQFEFNCLAVFSQLRGGVWPLKTVETVFSYIFYIYFLYLFSIYAILKKTVSTVSKRKICPLTWCFMDDSCVVQLS